MSFTSLPLPLIGTKTFAYRGLIDLHRSDGIRLISDYVCFVHGRTETTLLNEVIVYANQTVTKAGSIARNWDILVARLLRSRMTR